MRKICSLLLSLLLVCMLPVMACMEDAENAETAKQNEGITFSLISGFYNTPQKLDITCDIQDATIRYTTDGTAPTMNSTEYTETIPLASTMYTKDVLSRIRGTHKEDDYVPEADFPSAHVIRAGAFLPDGTLADETCGTYFVGFNRLRLYGKMPVISLMMDPSDLFNPERGIYVLGKAFDRWLEERGDEPYEAWQVKGNFSEKGKDWERPVMVDFMMSDTDVFCQKMGVRIKGATSRSGQQKSLRLIAREEYGKKTIKYDLFPGNTREDNGEPVKRYKSIVLRNGGNDRGNAKIRDPFISELARGMHLDISENRFCVAFINGEYWGLYAINEDYSDNYIQYHYGIDDKNVVMVKNGEPEGDEETDLTLYNEFMETILGSDPEDPEDYADICDMLDVDSLADYLALTLYIDNRDDIFSSNNFEMWRARETSDQPYADGKWRIMLFDTDYSTGIYNNGQDFIHDTVKEHLNDFSIADDNPSWMVLLLLDNEEFLQKAIMAMCDVRNIYYRPERVNALLNQWRALYLPQIKETFKRFGPEWIARWNLDRHPGASIDSISTFFFGRHEWFLTYMQDQFGLEFPKNINLKGFDEGGKILLNNRNVAFEEDVNVQYFAEYPITATAVAPEGKTFTGWEISGNAEADDLMTETVEIRFTGDFTLTAKFE